MTRLMLWKDYRELRVPPLILTAFALAIVGAMPRVLDIDSTGVRVFAVLFVWLGGLVTGAMMLANETETGGQNLLEQLPLTRWRVWCSKLLFAVGVTAIQMVAVAIAVIVNSQGSPRMGDDAAAAIFYVVPLAAFIGLGWGLMGSAFGRSVSTTISWGLVAQLASFAVALFLFAAVGIVIRLILRSIESVTLDWFLFYVGEIAGMSLAAIVFVLPYAISYRRYTAIDRRRQMKSMQRGLMGRVGGRVAAIRSTLWLAWLQSRRFLLGGAIAAVVMGPLLFVDPIPIWVVWSSAVGVVAGVGLSSDEHRYGAHRFLAEQRLPLGWIWLGKLTIRFAGAAIISALTLMVAVGAARLVHALDIRWGGETRGMPTYAKQYTIAQSVGLNIIIFLPLVYGLSFGSLAGLLFR
jgi:hypothetical protein